MDRKEYADYEKRVHEFFENEGVINLTQIDPEKDSYFSWSPCECCCRDLGGNRYECSGWHPIKEIAISYDICIHCLYYAEYGRLDDTTMLEIENLP